MAIKLGKYEICILDLFTDNGQLSSTKLWRHIGYSFISYKFMQLSEPSVEWMIAYASLIVCDAGFNAFLKRKYPYVGNSERAPNFSRNHHGNGDEYPDGMDGGLEPRKGAKKAGFSMRGRKNRNEGGE
jgi:hypothetical protein